MKFIVTGGGTGGHIYPALAIAKGLQEKYGAEVVYFGGTRGLEAEIVPREGLSFRSIELSGLKRSISYANILAFWQALKGFREARRIIKEFAPAAVIGTGGYVCGPVVLAAALSGFPTLIHEQNAFPGITNRILSRFTSCVALTFEDAKRFFPSKAKLKVTGLPVRKEILNRNKAEGRSKLGMPQKGILVLSFGGSQGARSINNSMLHVFKRFAGREGIFFLHVTGPNNYEVFMEQFNSMKIPLYGNITITSYIHDMSSAYAAADLVISRAGAATLAEITAQGLPSILIPYPYATDNHQEYNARALKRANAAVLILDKDLSGNILSSEIERLTGDAGLLASMAEASKALGKPNALDDILDCIQGLIDK